MNIIRLLLTRQQVASFCTLTVLLTFATYWLPLPRSALPFLMVLIPLIVAIGLTAITEDAAGVRLLLAKAGQWRIRLRWLAVALLLALLLRLMMSFSALWVGLIPVIQLRAASPGQLLVLALIVITAALPEEVGWRGYVLPQLLKQHTALFASLVIGVAWGTLHLALLLPGMMNAGASVLATLIQIVGLSVLATWLYVNSEGNLGLTTIFHAAQNFFVIINAGIALESQAWLMAGVYGIAAIMIAIWTGPMLVHKSAVRIEARPIG